jgi:hypothetical protein
MISPKEIKSIEPAGVLDGEPCQLITTIGGLWVMAGKTKGGKPQALAAGSHPAIVKYNVLKQYGPRYQPALMKSEVEPEPIVHDLTQTHMSKNNAHKGFKLFTVCHADRVECVVMNKNEEVCVQVALIKADSLEIKNDIKISDPKLGREFEKPAIEMVRAFAEEAFALKKEFISMESKKISAAQARKM